MKAILLGILASVIGASAVLLFQDIAPREHPVTAGHTPAVSQREASGNADLATEVAALRRELAEVRAQVAALSSASASAEASEAPAPAEPPSPAPEPDITVLLEEALHAERPDAASEASLRRELEAAVAPLGGISVKEVLCSTAVCRAELVHEGGTAPQELSMRLAFHPAFQRQTYFEPDFTVSPPRSRVFLARGEGSLLSRPDNR